MNRTRNLLLLIVLILILAGLALFAWQNWSPDVSLAFLGLRSLPLPLSVWILAAFLGGVITYLLIYSIFGLSNFLFKRNSQPRKPRPRTSQNYEEDETWEDGDITSNTKTSNGPSDRQASKDAQAPFNLKKSSKPTQKNENYDDWEQGPPKVNPSWDDDLTDERDLEDTEDFPNQTATDQNYEVKQQPKTESWSGSVYSYGYRDPSGSGVGQSESVYDADYRVITTPPPPSTHIPQNQNQQDREDWGFNDQELDEARDSEDKSSNGEQQK